mmetsp:Transcript_9043/g.10442  ORF Transcript_9043/g.10442 Transcript_9043/m.10442 type:complete len:203 (-) Transcript_9043:300-908(-)
MRSLDGVCYSILHHVTYHTLSLPSILNSPPYIFFQKPVVTLLPFNIFMVVSKNLTIFKRCPCLIRPCFLHSLFIHFSSIRVGWNRTWKFTLLYRARNYQGLTAHLINFIFATLSQKFVGILFINFLFFTSTCLLHHFMVTDVVSPRDHYATHDSFFVIFTSFYKFAAKVSHLLSIFKCFPLFKGGGTLYKFFVEIFGTLAHP